MEVDMYNVLLVLVPIGAMLLGVFAGYWFNNINKKTDLNSEKINDNKIDINQNTSKLDLAKKLNEQAQTHLREDMSGLAKQMTKTFNTLESIGILSRKNESDIQTLKNQQSWIAERVRSRHKKDS